VATVFLVAAGILELSSSCMLEIPALAQATAAMALLLMRQTNRLGVKLVVAFCWRPRS